MDLREHLRNTQDFFAYAVTHINGFPEKHRMSPARAVTELISAVETAIKWSKSKVARHWLNLSLQDLLSARASLESGQMPEVERHLGSAESFFEDACRGRRLTTDFVVGSDGTVRKPETTQEAPTRDARAETADDDADIP